MHCGVPCGWSQPVAGDLHGEREPSFDVADPPLFESQAAFLDRHGLLSPTERHRLSDADFAPERIVDIIGELAG